MDASNGFIQGSVPTLVSKLASDHVPKISIIMRLRDWDHSISDNNLYTESTYMQPPVNFPLMHYVHTINDRLLCMQIKCDEAKPKCLRCTKAGSDCEYEYLTCTGRYAIQRTKPAPRPPSEQVKKIEKELQETYNALDLVGPFDYPMGSNLHTTFPRSTAWDSLIQQCSSASTSSGNTVLPLDSLKTCDYPLLSAPIRNSDNLKPTSGKANLMNALLNPTTVDSPIPFVNPFVNTSHRTPSSHDSPNIDRCEAEIEDMRCVRESFFSQQINLNSTAESNSLPFVLQSYARWIPLIVFDPLKIAHQVKKVLIGQFISPTSRSRIFVFSRLIRSLSESWVIDERERRMFETLRGEISYSLARYTVCNNQHSTGEMERQKADRALDNTLEIFSILIFSSPLSTTLHTLRIAAPAFLAAFPPPHPPHLTTILLDRRLNVRVFVALDIAFSLVTGRATFCKYDVPWNLRESLCSHLFFEGEDHGLRWLYGIPDQYAIIFAYINKLREGGNPTEELVRQIEENISNITIMPACTRDPALRVGRMAVQECWRFKAGIASTKSSQRQLICSRLLQLPDLTRPNTVGSDLWRILQEVWTQTNLECRGSRWDDLRQACNKVTGL
ncbi:fungal zn(2)-Cys(6) binuclear cluster domain-containing protein [Rhizoctonia solani AG-1 IA]|uniref:Fungal zn(2)-Cys(6) binuclear cluster domain-containing protein n=1 Tax=Thanatephorus cucumeris (strain AG1-IA) TaxID=983506 RepID=L8WRW3_THACA|nr:fungal zn(2)-Cys(6) binuclear cluster domain-containing protein [Rhizoctonia solani AG-1 IA]